MQKPLEILPFIKQLIQMSKKMENLDIIKSISVVGLDAVETVTQNGLITDQKVTKMSGNLLEQRKSLKESFSSTIMPADLGRVAFYYAEGRALPESRGLLMRVSFLSFNLYGGGCRLGRIAFRYDMQGHFPCGGTVLHM